MKSLNKSQFPLHNAVLMMALAAAYPLSAAIAAPAGTTQFAAGDVSVRREDGRAEALVKGKDIESGQAIVTGPTGRAQVRFSDGGLISLQPNTEFKISNYVDQASPKEDRFVVDLLRGSMRAITGLIGKRNRDNYKVMTTTATIGIRGSGFNAGYNPDGTLGVTTELDSIEVCNAAGCVGLTAGESVVVLNNQTLPVRTNTRADVPTPQTRRNVVVAGDQVDTKGERTALRARIAEAKAKAEARAEAAAEVPSPSPAPTTRLLTGIGFTSASLRGDGFKPHSSINGTLQVGDAKDSSQPNAYSTADGTGTRIGGATVISSTGSLATSDYLSIGTWEGATWINSDGLTTIDGHTVFAVGIATPPSALITLGATRGSYALRNATPVFASVGGPGILLSSSSLTADFRLAYVDVKLDIQMPATGILAAGTTTAQLQTPGSYNLRGGLSYSSAGTFAGSLAFSGSGCSGSGAYCRAGNVEGFFSGPVAQNAVLSFGAFNSANGTLLGAASFSRSTANSPPATPSNAQLTDLTIMAREGTGVLPIYDLKSETNTTLTPVFNGERMNSFINTSGSLNVTVANLDPQTGTFGAIGVISDADFIGWGNWVSARAEKKIGSYTAESGLLDSVHYLVGRPTSTFQMPASGIGIYDLIGGTAPTANSAGRGTQTGQLLGASLEANFATGNMSASVRTQFGDTAVDIVKQSATFTPGSASFSGSTSGTTVNGFFTGNQASRAGMVYSTGSPIGQVTGAAAFQRSSLTPLAITGTVQ